MASSTHNVDLVITPRWQPPVAITEGSWTDTGNSWTDSSSGTMMSFQSARGPRFRTLLAVEEHRVTDGRMFRFGALYSRKTPLPLMFLMRNTEGHEDSVFVGNITRIWREGNMIWGQGEFDNSPDNPVAATAARLVRDNKMNGISVDTIITRPVEYLTDENENLTGFDILGAELMGATIVPFPAFEQTFIRMEEDGEEYLAASALDPTFPDIDSAAFTLPEPDVLMPWTVTPDGRVFGHLAAWGECHVGITDSCAIAPRSKSNYAHFLIGRLGNERLGTVTMNTLHAGGGMTRNQVERHYADTGTVAAIVKVVDGALGPWVCGVLDPNLSEQDRLRLSVCGISGDWRGGELIGILAVPKPGFTVPRYEDDYALVASAITTFECVGCNESEKAAAEVAAQIEEAEAEVIDIAEPIEETEDGVLVIVDEEPTAEDLEETDEDLALDLETILDDVLAQIEYRRFLELIG
jgi:hypothetical protein